ncbi:MAG: GGDEF domain-containing protein [Clostridiales bacterium]|nr:GGDEF domain-containing protein [Clostridiales bacterium]
MENVNIKNEVIDSLHITQVLSDMQVGFWVIELPDHSAPKMYGDKTMYAILGIDTLSPEEVYEHWTRNIDPKYMELVVQTVEAIKRGETSEVKYLWQHPKKGWIWVRCGGYLDETYKEGSRFKGWHYDLTNELETDVMDISHDIVDAKKLKLYSPYIIENIEELYEIDSETLQLNTIFYEKNKYHQIEEGKDIFYAIKKQVHPDYIERLNNVFQPASLKKIIDEKQMRQIECKVKTISGEYCWVEAKVFSVDIMGSSKLLFCISNISDKKRVDDLTNEKNEMVNAFYNVYTSIVEINLGTEKAYVLKSNTEELQGIFSVKEFYKLIIERFAIDSEKNAIKRFFNIGNLKSIVERREKYSFDFQLKEEGKKFKWKRIEVLLVPDNKEKLYLVFSDVDEQHMMDSILKNFVFNNNDYLYYVDAKNNSFLSFYRNDEKGISPSQSGDDYESVMIDYTKKYAAPEDMHKLIEFMKPEYMAKRLQNEDSYKLEAGMIDDDGSYRRKEVTIQSYDKENEILFIIRKDITKEYLKQKNQKESLENAKRMADTDSLTNLYNRKGACREIEKRLSEMGDEQDAFIIMDLDNFKAVNDCLGHLQGDELLRKTAKTLKENFRKTDVIARLGGDEFIIYMKDIKDQKTVVKAAEKLLANLQVTYPWKTGNINISASVGIAIAPMDGICFEELYEKSDKALYNAKREGKNRFSFF